MLKQRRDAAQSVIDTLIPAECAIDAAIQQWAHFVTNLPAARVAAGVAAETGHEAIASGTETLVLLVQARAKMLATHNELALTRTTMGLDATSFGGLMPKKASLTPPLELVRDAA